MSVEIEEKVFTYNVKVVVEWEYEVEVGSEAEAEAEGWKYEDYRGFASVYSIDVEDITPEEEGKCDVCEHADGEPHCDCGDCDCGEEEEEN